MASLVGLRIAARRSATALLRPSAPPLARAALLPAAAYAPALLQTTPTNTPRSRRPYGTTRPAAASDDSGSHSDFAPQRKSVEDDEASTQEMIKDHVTSNRVMLYMKGNPSMPMCGFSATVVQILQKEGADFSSVNVLDYPTIREGVKKFSDWPTIPQLYVGGEFIGGCDIVTSMHQSGELGELLKDEEKKE